MKPTITANLSGTEFIFETDAYALMEQYLQSLREAFDARRLDTDDLLADIEARCAEILREPRVDGSRIVTIVFVRDLIDRMGQPQEIFDEDASFPPPAPAASPSVGPPPIRKRLYRDPQNKLLGGVCSGIAVYCGWDPVWVRLATVGLAFLSLSTMTMVYIILWIVLKPANTPYQQMQLRGVSPTLQNIGNAVTGTFRSVKNYMSHTSPSGDVGQEVAECEFERLDPVAEQPKATGAKRFAQVVNRIASILFKVLLGIFGLVSIPALIGLVTSLIVMVGLHDTFLLEVATEINDPVSTVILTHMPLVIWMVVSAIVFFAVPAVAMVWMLCRLFMGKKAKPVPTAPKIVMLVLWLGAILSMAICGEVLDVLTLL